MKGYIKSLQSRCYEAADGDLSDEQMQALADEAMGAFGSLPIFGISVQRAIKAKNWNMLAGAIGSCMQIESQPDRTTITQVSQSSARATAESHVSIYQVFDLIDSDEDLSEEDKAALQSLLTEAKKEAVGKDSGAFARIGAKVMEGIENATPGVVSGAISYLASLAATHFGS